MVSWGPALLSSRTGKLLCEDDFGVGCDEAVFSCCERDMFLYQYEHANVIRA